MGESKIEIGLRNEAQCHAEEQAECERRGEYSEANDYKYTSQLMLKAADRIAELEDLWCKESDIETSHAKALNDRHERRIEAFSRRIAELEAVVEKLPKTKDGVPVKPGQLLWGTGADGEIVCIATGKGLMMLDDAETFDEPGENLPQESFYGDPTWCYSTREAALAAQEARNAK